MTSRTNQLDLILFVVQRATGAILAILLLVHLITIMFAVQGELTVAEILSRVQSNIAWIAFYGLFIITAVVHSMIGLRNIIAEMTGLSKRAVDLVVTFYAVFSLVLGYEALNAIW